MGGIRFFSFLSQLDPVTTNWFKGMNNTVPFEVKKIINDNLIKPCKSIIVNKANVFYFPVINNTNDSWRNIAKNDHHGTIEVTGLVFDSYYGFSNPNGTGYIDTHFNPLTQGGGKYLLNDAAIGIYISSKNRFTSYEVPLSAWESTLKISCIYAHISAGYITAGINSSTIDVPNFPFFNGLIISSRENPNSVIVKNQNIANQSGSANSNAIPNANFKLFKYDGGNVPFLGTISFVYIGASLTDTEFTTLNNAVNETLIQLLFYKYGKDNWGVKMAKSYFYDLHGFEKYEAWEVYEFIKRMQPNYVDGETTGYYYNTFGPLGQNKTIADFIMLFKAGGNLIANTWVKTGALLRWNQDSAITNSNTMPAYTRGSNWGIITVSSMDEWENVTLLDIHQSINSINSFYGNMPKFYGLLKKSSNVKTTLYAYYNRAKIDIRNQPISSQSNGVHISSPSYPGGNKALLSDFIGGSYDVYVRINGFSYANWGSVSGNASQFTNEGYNCIIFEFSQDNNIYGTLKNLVISNTIWYIYFNRTSLTGGISSWNKNIKQLNFNICNFSTLEVDNQLSVIDSYFTGSVVPINNLLVYLNGTGMGVPTGGVNNVNRLSIIAKHVAKNLTATINVNS